MTTRSIALAAILGMAAHAQTVSAATGNAYADAVLSDTPLVYYRFDEATGTTAQDGSGNGRNGTFANVSLGNAAASVGLGTAGGFNNNNSSVAVPALGSRAQVTIELWARPNSFATFDTLYNGDGWSAGWIHYHFVNNNQLEFSVNGNNPTDTYVGSSTVFRTGRWQHVVVTYDSDARELRVYVDGQLLATQTYTTAVAASLSAAHIGAWNGNSRGYDGLLDEFAVYGSVLSAERVFAHYLAGVMVAITQQPANATVFAGSTATFAVGALAGDGTLSYQWQRDGVNLTDATNASYTTPILSTSDNNAKFRCLVSAGGVTNASGDATLTVYAREAVPAPMAWWTFDDTLLDQGGSATAHDGDFQGNVALDSSTPHDVGSSAYFLGDGTGRMDVENDTDLNLNVGSPFTLSAWIRTEFTTGNRVIVAKSPPAANVIASGSGTHTAAWFVGTDGRLVYDLFWVGEVRSSTVVRNGEWVHVMMTFDGSSYRLYVNGRLDTTRTMAGANEGANSEPAWEFTLGQSLNSNYPGSDASANFQGNIDEVGFWNSALSGAQVFGVYQEGIPAVAISITQQPADVIAVLGATASFTVAATAVGTSAEVKYQWQKNGTDIPDATQPTYTTAALTPSDHGARYRCQISAGPASAATREALVNIVDNSSPYAAAVLADTPLVYYRFEEVPGFGAAIDSTPQGKNGFYADVTLGNPSLNSILGQAGSFNNVNSSVAVPALGDQLAQLTLEVWLKPNSMVTFDTIFNVDGWSSGWVHSHLGNGNQIEFSVNGTQPGDNWLAGPAYFQNGQWTHVALVYDSAALTLTLYINGQAIDTRTYSSAIPANLAAAHLGAWNGNDRAFDGMMDEFALYSTALSADRILAHYSAAGFLIVFTQQPSDATVLAGSSATFSVQAVLSVGNEPIQYQWLKNGVAIPGATDATYTTPALAVGDNGAKYSVVASASGGSSTSREAVVTVVELTAAPAARAWLSFEQTLGDRTGQGHDGTLAGSADYSADVANATAGTASFAFPSAGRVELANSGDLNMNSGVPFTISAWIKTAFNSGTHVILGKSPANAQPGGEGTHTTALFVDENGRLVYDVYYVGANLSTTTVRNGNWTHVVVTYDGSTYRFYINGQPEMTTGQYDTQGGANEPAGSDWVFTIGQSLNTIYPGGDWEGNLDEVAFWQSTLSPEQVFTLFAAGFEGVVGPRLNWTKTGNQLTFSWAGTGYHLQQNGDVANPAGWSDVPDSSSSPVNVSIGAETRFFRLVKP